MNYYLKTTDFYFIDPHGSWDEAGTVKAVVYCENDIDVSKSYTEVDLNPETATEEELLEDIEYFEEEFGCKREDWEPSKSEDGYNSETESTIYRKLDLEEYLTIDLIINHYNSL